MAVVETIIPSSAAPALSLLEETEPTLQAHALRSLLSLADSFWPEISGAVDKIQQLSEDDSFPEKKLAAIVAAKVNFHLGSLDEALHYALSAGSLFDVDAETEFANTLRARCIDEYIRFKSKETDLTTKDDDKMITEGSSADHHYLKQLESVVERVLHGCIQKGEIREAIGVAIEAHRLDKVELAINEGCKIDENKIEILKYCFKCAQNLISSRGYRHKVLNLIASIHVSSFPPEKRDFIAVANCYAFVRNAQGIADILMSLVSDEQVAGKPNESDLELMAMQIAFDIVDNDAPFFAPKIYSLLPATPEPPAPTPTEGASAPQEDSSIAPQAMDTDTPGENNATPSEVAKETKTTPPAPPMSNQDKKILKLKKILNGDITAELYLNFLCTNNRSDTYLLRKIKQALDGRSSVCHSALLFANAIAHSGTAIDKFLRDNLDWLQRATAWAKFSATSCLGVIHNRHTAGAINILSPYLPSETPSRGSTPTSYSEAGSLYALGLISVGAGRNVDLLKHATDLGPQPVIARDYILEQMRASETGDVVKHGACLGMGLSAMATWDGGEQESPYYEEMKQVLYSSSSAVASEAAGIGMGLVALGSGSETVCDEMLAFARETDHEKVTRGLALGVALVLYGREDDAMKIIDLMIKDSEPIIRYGAMYAVALAYCGTADNKAIRLLLHSAVSDVSDDVKRAAVIALGFVLFKHPKLLPNVVSLLAKSCHAHVRYGASLAIGIACMGTGMPAAVNMLERLTSDPSDFVKQGALIGLSMVFMHHTAERSPRSAEMRKTLEATWSQKLEDVITRFGAVVGAGLADSGGRNGIIALTSATGHPRMSAIVGLAMFTNFWYWYPLVHFVGLSIKPAALICLNKDAKMPKMKVQCNISEDMYAYVPSGPPEKPKEATSAPKAVLSVTAKSLAKAQKRAEKKKKESEEKSEDQSTEKSNGETEAKDTSKSNDSAAMEDDNKKETSKKAGYSILENPCRVLPAQEQYMSWSVKGESDPRYRPVLGERMSGIVMVRDSKPGDSEDLVAMQTMAQPYPVTIRSSPDSNRATNTVEVQDEPESNVPVPESFIYTDENEDEDGDQKMEDKKDEKEKKEDSNEDNEKGGETAQ